MEDNHIYRVSRDNSHCIEGLPSKPVIQQVKVERKTDKCFWQGGRRRVTAQVYEQEWIYYHCESDAISEYWEQTHKANDKVRAVLKEARSLSAYFSRKLSFPADSEEPKSLHK